MLLERTGLEADERERVAHPGVRPGDRQGSDPAGTDRPPGPRRCSPRSGAPLQRGGSRAVRRDPSRAVEALEHRMSAPRAGRRVEPLRAGYRRSAPPRHRAVHGLPADVLTTSTTSRAGRTTCCTRVRPTGWGSASAPADAHPRFPRASCVGNSRSSCWRRCCSTVRSWHRARRRDRRPRLRRRVVPRDSSTRWSTRTPATSREGAPGATADGRVLRVEQRRHRVPRVRDGVIFGADPSST